jgi:hypothetical protein
VTLAGAYAYVADGGYGLRVIDVSDPLQPKEAGFYDTPGDPFAVAIAGDYAYVADGGSGLRVIDVSDPAHPQEVGYYRSTGSARGVAAAGSFAYVGDYDGGLQTVEFLGAGVEESRKPQATRSKPEPTIVRGELRIGNRGPKTGDRAELLDISGRKVLDLHPGANDVRALAPGVYFVRAVGREPSAVTKVILER